jgi:hypothetical protein
MWWRRDRVAIEEAVLLVDCLKETEQVGPPARGELPTGHPNGGLDAPILWSSSSIRQPACPSCGPAPLGLVLNEPEAWPSFLVEPSSTPV